MAYVNSPEGYSRIAPSDEHILGSAGLNDSTEAAGLYYRAQLLSRKDQLTERLIDNAAAVSFHDYQYWAELGWKAQHGSFAAVERFGRKSLEELEELHVALRAITGPAMEDRSQEQVEAVLELGDVGWCLAAQASNSSASLDASLKNSIYKYVMGIQYIEDGRPTKPGWRDLAASLATKYEILTIGDLDTLIANGFEPTASPAMNIFEADKPDGDLHSHFGLLAMIIISLRNQTEQQYGYGETKNDANEDVYIMPEIYNDKSKSIGETTANGLLQVTYIAHHGLQTTLAHTIQENVKKIDGRIRSGTVDKSDRL